MTEAFLSDPLHHKIPRDYTALYDLAIERTPHIRYILLYVLCTWIIYRLFIYPRWVSPLRHLPQPKGGYPLIGHFLARFQEPIGESYLQFMEDVPNDGIILFRDIFNTDHLLVTLPETLSEVLTKKPYQFEKPYEMREFSRRIIGRGLLTAEGNVHKYQRKRVFPNFTLRNTKSLVPISWKKGLEMIRSISSLMRSNSNNHPELVVDMNEWATSITLDVLSVAALGRDAGILRSSMHPLKEAYDEAFRQTSPKKMLFGMTLCRMNWLADYLPWNLDDKDKFAVSFLRKYCWDAIKDKRRTKIPGKEPSDLLSSLIASDTLSDEQLVEQLLSVLAAGHETVAATFAWSIFLLASHPSIQYRLRQEVQSCIETKDLGSENDDIADLLQSLPLLNGVCNETIRLYPSVPLTPRVASCDTSILHTFVPKGTNVMVTPRATNRSSRLWGPDANIFVPDRWINHDSGEIKRTGGSDSMYCMLTFLHGVRGCIGSEYAKAELRSMVALMVSTFKMDVANPEERVIPAGRVVTRPANKDGKAMIKLEILEGC